MRVEGNVGDSRMEFVNAREVERKKNDGTEVVRLLKALCLVCVCILCVQCVMLLLLLCKN